MRLIIYHQADHLAAYTRQKIEALDTQKSLDLVFTTELPADFLLSEYVLWLAGAVPLSDLAASAAQLAGYKNGLLCVGAAALAMAKHFGAEVIATKNYAPSDTLLQINAPDNVLRRLPRQCQAPILLPQFQIGKLPNALSTLAKNPQGQILAWKHRNQPTQGILTHPASFGWQPLDGLAIIQNWLGL
jgi:hypothetical protein